MAPLPLPKLQELREKFMYDITPFSAAMNSASHKAAYNDEADDLPELSQGQFLYHHIPVRLRDMPICFTLIGINILLIGYEYNGRCVVMYSETWITRTAGDHQNQCEL